jgi:transposase-like protein
VIVWPCRLDVSTYAARGREVTPPRPACPRCGGPTVRWSGYNRHLRDVELHRIFVPRVRCKRCGVTAALLPWFVTPYRWDSVDVIGRALELSVGGQGVRRIAAALARPETTVREWCRRFARTADTLARVLLAAAQAGRASICRPHPDPAASPRPTPEQALRAAKSDGRIGDDLPADGRDPDRLPERVAQVEVDVSAVASDPDVHRADGPFEERPTHQDVERIAKGLAASGPTVGLVEPA